MQKLGMKRLKWVLGRCVWDSPRRLFLAQKEILERRCFLIDTMEGESASV